MTLFAPRVTVGVTPDEGVQALNCGGFRSASLLTKELPRLNVERVGEPADGLHLGGRPTLQTGDGSPVDAAPLGEIGLRHCPFNSPVQQTRNWSNGGARHLPADGNGWHRRGVAVDWLPRHGLGKDKESRRIVHACKALKKRTPQLKGVA